MSTYRANSFRSFVITCAFVFSATHSTAAFAAAVDPCSHARPMELGGVERVFSDGEESSFVVSVDVPAPGLLALDVLNGRPAAAQLHFLGKRCSAKRADDVSAERVHELIDGALIYARSAGTYYFRVGAQDPSRPVHELRIRSGFARGPLRSKEENPIDEILPIVEGCLTPFPEHDHDENYVEEALPALVDCMTPLAGFRLEGSEEYLIGEILPGEENPIDEILPGEENPIDEILPMRIGSFTQDLRSQLASICRAQLADDVGDSLFCASALRTRARVSGEIRNDAGEDVDVFVVTLPRRATLDVKLSGDGVELSVYDRHGQPMAVGGEAPLRSVRAFAPDTYFLKVTGTGAGEGEYTLSVRPRRW